MLVARKDGYEIDRPIWPNSPYCGLPVPKLKDTRRLPVAVGEEAIGAISRLLGRFNNDRSRKACHRPVFSIYIAFVKLEWDIWLEMSDQGLRKESSGD